MEEFCVCGHDKKAHSNGKGNLSTACLMCFVDVIVGEGPIPKTHEALHDFKLDNLKFIEDEAKRRNLIN